MRGLCRLIIGLYVLAYLVGLFLLAVGTFGWFGQPQSPLSGLLLIALGMPWTQLLIDTPLVGIVLGLLAPVVNIAILSLICRGLARLRR